MTTPPNTQKLNSALCVIAAVFTIAANTALAAEDARPVAKTLITNACIFDGKSDKLTEGMSVLVEGNKIAKTIEAPRGGGTSASADAVQRVWPLPLKAAGTCELDPHCRVQAVICSTSGMLCTGK